MSDEAHCVLDGNEAAARIAYALSEVVAIYPITPASPMGERADEWAAAERKNRWNGVPEVVEMQSEAGAAGAVHGALQGGALATTFTASQGLLLMIPEMYKIAGELLPTVFHVASRAVAGQALSIFGDHSDVMAARATGFALLASGSVQEVMDLALVAHAASLRSRVPFMHFFDGFRTSHEASRIRPVDDDVLRALVDDAAVAEHRHRALSPGHPVLRGSSQNPDVYFQAREAAEPYYASLPATVRAVMDELAALTGRRYRLFDYVGACEPERVLVLMGSGAEAAHETVEALAGRGERIGLVKVRLFRPFSAEAFIEALPASVRHIAVLDRTKEAGADGEPLYKDVVTALARAHARGERPGIPPRVVGGRYGLGQKEFDPAMVKAVFDELLADVPREGFTVGIDDDVTGNSLPRADGFVPVEHWSAVFFGLGSDGTVSAVRNTTRILGERTDHYVQGYSAYDSRKSGAQTISYLRVAAGPIRSSYRIGQGQANVVACHQPRFVSRYAMLDKAAPGGVFLLNTAISPDRVWGTLPREVQQQIIHKALAFYVVDAAAVADAAGLAHINTVMQTCFFAVSGLLPVGEAIAALKDAVSAYAKKGPEAVAANRAAIDGALAGLKRVSVPDAVTAEAGVPPAVPDEAPAFVRRVTGEILANRGDDIPVSALPPDGMFPLGTARWERRGLASELPVWEPDLCTQCGKCVFVCPHSAIRSKVFGAEALPGAPAAFQYAPLRGKGGEGRHMSYQILPDDCTGCRLCVEACPIHDPDDPERKALNMAPAEDRVAPERANWAFFEALVDADPAEVRREAIPTAMTLTPLFECSSACVGCGETPYLRLISQLFGERMVVANATGCSSIYGGNLPTTPWAAARSGRGPAWCNSLFEDNAEFGFGLSVAAERLGTTAREHLAALRETLDSDRVDAVLDAGQDTEAQIAAQRQAVAALTEGLARSQDPGVRYLLPLLEYLVRRSVWIVGGDGWAYDIGFGGVDHVLASGQDVNLLVLDTEVYSNTGGQASKATPLGATAKFAAGGKATRKKDLAQFAMDYEDVYVAQVAFGAKDTQTLRALLEADAYPGPALILAYSPCIEHGVDMSLALRQQLLAVQSGHWPLLRYDPRRRAAGKAPLRLDSDPPSIPFRDFALTEGRFRRLMRADPAAAERYLQEAEAAVRRRYERYRARTQRSVAGSE